MATTATNKEDTKFVIQYRDQFFHVEVWIYNQIPGIKPVAIPAIFIHALAIEESLMSWVAKGWLVLSTDFEIFERGSQSGVTQESSCLFRTDGRNKIAIKIYPIPSETDNSVASNTSDTNNQFPSELWEMNYDFVIYDIEDLATESAAKKLRKFYFWDERFQIFTERNIDFSTALYGTNSLGKDKERTIKASDALKYVIQTAASNKSKANETGDIKVGSTQGPAGIATPDIPLANIDTTLWNVGSEDSVILYTSPSNWCVLEDINYICQYLKADDKSSLFLLLDRYKKSWSLVSLANIISKANQNQIERFVVHDNASDDSEIATPYIPRAPSPENTFHSPLASRIDRYKFSPMVAHDDIKITNNPLHNYDFPTNAYQIYCGKNTAKELLTSMLEYSKGLFTGGKQLLININETKSSGLMITNNLVTRKFFVNDMSRVNMTKDFLFLNEALSFSSPGLTMRSPGKIIAIDRDMSSQTNFFDDRFLGQWFIVRVVHLFTQKTYVTDIVATKIDAFSKLWDSIDPPTSASGNASQ